MTQIIQSNPQSQIPDQDLPSVNITYKQTETKPQPVSLPNNNTQKEEQDPPSVVPPIEADKVMAQAPQENSELPSKRSSNV